VDAARFGLGSAGFDELILRQPHKESPEFDITAMVDLVFMMNIYFLVTFVMAAMAEIDLPLASHAAPLDGEAAVVLTIQGGGREPVVVTLGDREKGTPIRDSAQQVERIRSAVERGVAEGKTQVLIKAVQQVRLGDLFRVSAAASAVEGVTLNVAVVEKDKS